MRMLSSCVCQFYENAEQMAEATNQLQNMMESNKVQASQPIEGLVKLHGLFLRMVQQLTLSS